MIINLIKHPDCRIYNEWKEYTSTKKESAVLDTSSFENIDQYIKRSLNATARNRYNFSVKNGFRSQEIKWRVRNLFLEDIHSINTSAEIRQGNPMKESYLKFPTPLSDSDTCHKHFSTCIATFNSNGTMVAYISAHFCGDMAAASQILGHAAQLKNGVMLNCWVAFLNKCIERKIKAVTYSRWTDGVDGLRYWKHSVGMKPLIITASE